MSRPFRIDGKSGWWIRYTNTNVRGGTHCESARVLQEIFHRVLDRAGFPTQLRIGKSSFTPTCLAQASSTFPLNCIKDIAQREPR